MRKKISYIIVLLLLCCLVPTVSFAHRVSIFAYIDGGTLYTESYFADGRPVVNGKVLVYDQRDSLLLQGRSDKQGLCQFTKPKARDLMVVIEAGLGHRGRYLLQNKD